MFGGRGRGRGTAPKVVRNNHLIQCYIYKNVALFKGDTYVYRGLFKRNSGEFNKEHYGYVVPLDNLEKVKEEISIDLGIGKMKMIHRVYKKGNQQIITILNWLYQDSSVFLQRKFDKYQELLQHYKR